MKKHTVHKTPGQVEAWRIVLALPGREKTLHQYKRPVALDLATKKAAELASMLMPSWQWAGEIPAIEDLTSEDMLLILGDSVAKGAIECTL
jgi:hypothetical protein